MKRPAFDWKPLDQTALIAVKFKGVYPQGSDGNEFARQMLDFLERVLRETEATGVLIDLTDLDYTHGDAIGGLATPFLKQDVARRGVLVATGETARALAPLCEANAIFSIAGMDFVHSTEEALEQLQRPPKVIRPTAAVEVVASDPVWRLPADTSEKITASIRREGAPALDRLADTIQELLRDRSENIEGAVSALRYDMELTPKLQRVLAELVSAPWVDARLREGVSTHLNKPAIMRNAIAETLRRIAANRKSLAESAGPLYFGDMVPRDYSTAKASAKSGWPDLHQKLIGAQEQLEIAKKAARSGDDESRSTALAALDHAEQELRAAQLD